MKVKAHILVPGFIATLLAVSSQVHGSTSAVSPDLASSVKMGVVSHEDSDKAVSIPETTAAALGLFALGMLLLLRKRH